MEVTSEYPLAYLITFHTYGSWLHGEAKGSVDEFHNRPGDPFVIPSIDRNEAMRRRMVQTAQKLNREQRRCVATAIRGVCDHRVWDLLAINVRTNHGHSVVAAAAKPEKVMTDFKAWATRRLRESGLVTAEARVWSRHGSTRYLWDRVSVESACRYVVDGQGVDLR